MNHATLDQRLDALGTFPRCRPESTRRLGAILRELDVWDLVRINPLRFAEEHDFDAAEAVELFVHGAKVGLFDFVWNLICPTCGAIVTSGDSLSSFDAIGHCAMCDVEVEGRMDDQVEVAFALTSGILGARLDPFASEADYWRYFFSPNFNHSERVAALVEEASLGLRILGADETATFDFEAEPTRTYRIVSVERHVVGRVEPGEGDELSREAAFDLLPTGIVPDRIAVATGPVRATIRNRCKTPVGIALVRNDRRIAAALAEEPAWMTPFLTGKLLLNNQSFRDLFRVQQLVPGLHLPFRSLTILFTDLKGSTELYDKTGDAYAYTLVQQHYAELTEAVRENAGAVVKTMGDAIMASFSSPLDAVRAAVAMVDRIARLNEQWRREGHELGLKVGLHEGPALAVNADDRLDYFGQTVNIAARVQGLASAGEIWHTDEVLRASGVESLLRAGNYEESSHEVALKGVGHPVTVHQWTQSVHEDERK